MVFRQDVDLSHFILKCIFAQIVRIARSVIASNSPFEIKSQVYEEFSYSMHFNTHAAEVKSPRTLREIIVCKFF